MRRFAALSLGFFFVFACLVVSTSARASSLTPGDAYAACQASSYSGDGWSCKLLHNDGGTSGLCSVGGVDVPGMSKSDGSYTPVHTSGAQGPDYSWCVPDSCSGQVGPSGWRDAGGTIPADDGAGCCVSWVGGSDPDEGGSSEYTYADMHMQYGSYQRSGAYCAQLPPATPAQSQADKDVHCDHGELSCYDPINKEFCATTDSGESVCVPKDDSKSGGCASGATGSVCYGANGTPPPSPPDPPISKNQPPESSASGSVTAGGTTNNYTTNNYSGTSPGPGPSSSSTDSTGSSGSNQNASGNSPGPNADHGTDANGKCADGSVPTASGCSGTASDNGCTAPPQCFGDAVMCASFREQVAIRCNTSKAAGGSSSGLPSLADVPGALAAAGVPADGGASGDPSASGLVSSSDLGEDGFDASGLGFSRTCPESPTFDVLGHSYTLDLTPFCNFAGMLGWFVLLVGSLAGLRIVATGR